MEVRARSDNLMGDAPQQKSRDRAIRVFLSSTFRDMVAERNELCRRTFLELRKFCEERGVTFTDVDLRWGITEEQKTEGRVLPNCFDEICRCRPFFIGLLGERYGSTPEQVPADLIEREPWLAEFRYRSVTELEILHGVLRNPQMARHAFFYFRDPAYIDTLPASQQILYREVPSSQEVQEFGLEGAHQRCEARRQKLRALKETIRASDFPVRPYRDPEGLGRLVLEDLKGVIEGLYPEGSRPDPLRRETAYHDAVVEGLCRVFVGRRNYLSLLDRHVSGKGPPLVLLGAEGIGKSALLAKWSTDYSRKHPGEPLLLHFVGASPESTDWSRLVQRMLARIGDCLHIRMDVAAEPDELRRGFGAALGRAAEAGRLVLVIDNLSGLEERDLAPDLVWLPKEIPSNVRLILSTMPGRPLNELNRRGWPSLAVEPMMEEERRELINEYLSQYSKSLSKQHADELARSPQTGSPLYMLALLEEIRLCAEHATLGPMLRDYLLAGSTVELYHKILGRYEADYQRERPRLVQDTMRLLWAARRGLSETELLEMLKMGEERLPRAYWAPLYFAIEPLLLNRSGLLTFSHEFLRSVVEERYLASAEQREKIHGYLAYWYGRLDLSRRKLEELPWHLIQSQSWEDLAKLLASPAFLHAACADDRTTVMGYLAAIERDSDLTPRQVFQTVLEEPEANPRFAWEVAGLLGDMGYHQEAQRLAGALARIYEKADKVPHREASFDAMRQRLDEKVKTGEFASMDPFVEMQRNFERTQAKLLHKASLGNQAAALMKGGEMNRAMVLLKEEEQICREVGQESWLIGNLVNQGLVLEEQGDLEGALARYREQETIARKAGEKEGLADAISGQGRVQRANGEGGLALALLEQEEQLRREIADGEGLRQCLGTRALLLAGEGRCEEALQLHRELERSFQEAGDPAGQATSLQDQASILLRLNRPDEALRAYEEQERISRRYGLQDNLAGALEGRATVLYIKGQAEDALALLKEEERLCRDLGIRRGEVESLVRQALIHVERPGGIKDCQAALKTVGDLVRRHQLSAVEERLKPLLDHIQKKVKLLETL